jgi:putative peptidoglycan lipid II flippase
MVRKVFALLGREVNGLHEAAYALAAFTLLSQLVALARDRMIAGIVGPSAILDTFYAAFRLPDLVFVLTTSLVSSAVLMPQVVARLEDRETLKKFLNGAASFFALISVAVSALAFAFAPALVAWLAPGLADQGLAGELIVYTRALLLSPIFLGFSQIWGSVAQAYRRVALYALSPVVYNLGFVLGVGVFFPVWGVRGIVVGVLIGAALHALVVLPAAWRAGGGYVPTVRIPWREARGLVLESLPRSAALAMGQLATLVLVSVASRMAEGSISVYQLAANLQSVPLALIGTSYSMAAFPILAKLAAENDRAGFGRKLAEAARQIIFWSLPVVALFVVLRAQIVRVVLGAGSFGWDETRLVAAVLAALVLACVAQGLILIFARASYAAGDTWRPFAANLTGAIVTAGAGLAIPGYFAANPPALRELATLFRLSGVEGAEVVALGLASTAGAFVAATMLWALVSRRFAMRGAGLTRASVQGLLASLWAGLAAYIALGLTDQLFDDSFAVAVLAHGFLCGSIGLIAWTFALKAMGNPELELAIDALRRRVWKAPIVAADQTPVDQPPVA